MKFAFRPALSCTRRSARVWRAKLPIPEAGKRPTGIDVVQSRRQAAAKDNQRAFRAVSQLVVTVSKGASRAADEWADELADKVRRYAAVELREVRANPNKASVPEAVIQSEGTKVLQAIRPQDRVIALDERGRTVTSEDIAKMLAKAGDVSAARMVWCIGGPFGHAQSVIDRADDVIKLSTLVLNHQVANIVLLEQIYRGFTILRGEKYHH